MSCTNNMKQLALATHNYHDTFNRIPGVALKHHQTSDTGIFPAETAGTADVWKSFQYWPRGGGHKGLYQGMIGWAYFLLPFMEAQAIYDSIDRNRGSYVTSNNDFWLSGTDLSTPRGEPYHKTACESAPPAFQCPSTPVASVRGSQKDYCVPQIQTIEHVDETGASPGNKDGAATCVNCERGFGSITDGLSNTFMHLEFAHCPLRYDNGYGLNPFLWVGHWGEGTHVWGGWYPPNQIPGSENDMERGMYRRCKSFHPGGINTSAYDASVHFVSQTVDVERAFDGAITHNQGIATPIPWQ
jgi:hypothetical protein